MCRCPAHNFQTLTIPEHKDANTCNPLSTREIHLILGAGQVGTPENWHAGSINQSMVQEDRSKPCSIVFPRSSSRMEPQMSSTVTCLLMCLILAFYSFLSCFSTPWTLPSPLKHSPQTTRTQILVSGSTSGKTQTKKVDTRSSYRKQKLRMGH